MNRSTVSLAVCALLLGACGGDPNPTGHAGIAAQGEFDQAVGPDASVGAAPAHAALTPNAMLDALGRAQYIVRLDRSAMATMPLGPVVDHRFAPHHPAAAVHLVHALEARYGVVASQMTTLAGFTFIARLTTAQAAALATDPRVLAVTPDQAITLSSDATSVWQDGTGTGVGSQHVSWGTTAVGTGSSTTRVYVLDTGVTPSEDLNLVEEVNALCPPGAENAYCPTGNPAVVGCYAHSTHVAGIIGARANSFGTLGVAAGAPIVSVSALDPTGYDLGTCLPATLFPTTASLVAGLEWIMSDIAAHGEVGVVNMSLNGANFVAPGDLVTAIKQAATPAAGYPGAFLAESGGNDFADACSYAYTAHDPSDGIMVVGMLNDHGQAVRPLNGVDGSRNAPLAANEPGSNYGPCIEAWAPGRLIFSTWSTGYAYLTGTSMAAPHVAGLAARLGGSSPAAMEANVRAHLMALGSTDAEGLAIAMPTTSPLAANVPHDTPYAEAAVGGKTPFDPQIIPENGISTYTNETFVLGFASVGAGAYSCDLYRRLGTGTPILLGNGESFTLTNQQWAAGTWTVYSNTCPSAHTTVTETVPATVDFYVDNVVKDGQTVTLPESSTSVLRYASTNATSCDFTINDLNGFAPPPPAPGYPHDNNGNSATVPIYPKVGSWGYEVVCHDSAGGSTSASMTVVVTAPPVDNAAFVSQSVPSSVVAGATFSASVAFENTGNTTWTAANAYRMGSYAPLDNTTWGTSRVYLASGDAIAPNQTKTFTSTFTAPTTPGTYAFEWQMVHDGVAWFGGPSTSVNVVVEPPGVCSPGAIETCCPCSGGCGCEGTQTCTAAGQWSGCREYVCSPGLCK